MDEEIIQEETEEATEVVSDGMPGHVSRMVTEVTDLMYRIDSLNAMIDLHVPDTAGEDGIVLSAAEYDWMIAQLQNMIAYAHALQVRIKLAGYDVHVIEDPSQLSPESVEE